MAEKPQAWPGQGLASKTGEDRPLWSNKVKGTAHEPAAPTDSDTYEAPTGAGSGLAISAQRLAETAELDDVTGTATALRLFVGKLSSSTTAQRLREYFCVHMEAKGIPHAVASSTILDVYIPVGPQGRLRNFAFVSFANDNLLKLVLATGPGPSGTHIIDGRTVVLDVAAPRGLKVSEPGYLDVQGSSNTAVTLPGASGSRDETEDKDAKHGRQVGGGEYEGHSRYSRPRNGRGESMARPAMHDRSYRGGYGSALAGGIPQQGRRHAQERQHALQPPHAGSYMPMQENFSGLDPYGASMMAYAHHGYTGQASGGAYANVFPFHAQQATQMSRMGEFTQLQQATCDVGGMLPVPAISGSEYDPLLPCPDSRSPFMGIPWVGIPRG